MHAARIVPLALAVALLLPRAAPAWTDARPSGLVTELALDRDGGAVVTLRIRWRILAGRLHQFDLVDLPADLSLQEASAITASGAPVPLTTRAPAPGRLEVSLGDEGGGVRRGAVNVVLRYTTSLRAQGSIQRAGPDAVVEVATVPWERGLEAAEIRVALPSSARRAQWIPDDTPGVDAATTTELSRDVVHALRRHVPAGTRWTARLAVNPNLFPWLAAGVAHSPHALPRAPRRPWPVLLLGAALAVALLGAGAALTPRAPGAPGPLVPLPPKAAALPAALVVLGAAAQAAALAEVPFALAAGTLLVLTAVALRVPRPGPLVLADRAAPVRLVAGRELLARSPRPSRRVVPAAVAVLVAAAGLAGVAARHHALALGVAAVDLGVAAVALLALRHATRAPCDAWVLAPLARRLERLVHRSRCARIAWRVRGDVQATGSVRARLVPRPGWRLARGVHALECAVAMHPGTFGWRPTAVAILRVASGCPMERRLRLLATRAGSLRTSADGDLLAYSVELVGPDRDAALQELRVLVAELFVRAPAPSARAVVAAEALGASA